MTKGRFSGSTVKEGVWPRRSWVLGSLLGAGACAEVYEASPTLPLDHQHDKGMQWVAKVSPLPPPEAPKKGKKRSSEELSADVLHMEHSLYRNKLSTHPGVPRMPYHGGYGDDASVGVRFIIMEKLGPTLSSIAKEKRGLSPALAAQYGRQIVRALEMLHQECRLLFVDMKPENVMLGLSGDNEPSSLRLIDFGLSRSYIGQGGAHKPLSQSGVEGTPDFLSLASHGGASPSRRDDLEASAYVLLSLMGRQLPWSNAKSDVEGCKLKGATDLAELCEGVAPLASWITMARSIPYEGRPDYAAFIKLLDELERAPGAGKMANTGTSSPAPKRVRKGSSAAAVSTKSSSPTRKRTSVSESAKRNAKVTAARTVEAPAKVCSNEGPAVAATEAQPARVPSAKKKRGRTLARTPQKEDARKSTGATPISAGDGPPACFSLVCCEGPHNGEIFPVPIAAMGASVTLGSSSDADIVLSGDKQLSRLHLELQLARGSSTLRVKDLGSLNGTKINDRAISKRSNGAIVNKDDVITLGRTQLTLVLC